MDKPQFVGLTFDQLRAANKSRLVVFKNKHGKLSHSQSDGSDWSPAQWLQAVIGELGEYANERKKFERGDLTWEEFKEKAEEELADAQTYLDILALRCLDLHGRDDLACQAGTVAHKTGVNLGVVTAVKFNKVSKRVGCDIYLGEGMSLEEAYQLRDFLNALYPDCSRPKGTRHAKDCTCSLCRNEPEFVPPNGRVWVRSGCAVKWDWQHKKDGIADHEVMNGDYIPIESWAADRTNPRYCSRIPRNAQECYDHGGIDSVSAEKFCRFMGWEIGDTIQRNNSIDEAATMKIMSFGQSGTRMYSDKFSWTMDDPIDTWSLVSKADLTPAWSAYSHAKEDK